VVLEKDENDEIDPSMRNEEVLHKVKRRRIAYIQ
jgi:hypothetical protein